MLFRQRLRKSNSDPLYLAYVNVCKKPTFLLFVNTLSPNQSRLLSSNGLTFSTLLQPIHSLNNKSTTIPPHPNLTPRGTHKNPTWLVDASSLSSTTSPPPRAVTLIPGDGVGPLETNAVEQVMEAMHAPVFFEKYDAHGDLSRVPQELIESIKKNEVCLKGGLRTPVGGGVSSLNVQLRKELDLYALLVNCFNLPGLPTRHENVDIVVIRENTEGEYSGLEREVVPGVVEVHFLFFHFQLFNFNSMLYNQNLLFMGC